jgi:hypothetical protein
MGTDETNLPKLAAPARRALHELATPALRTSPRSPSPTS